MKQYFFIFLGLLFATAIIPACSDDDTDTLCDELTWFEDADGDGLGNPDVSQVSCEQPTGYVEDNTDTNDAADPDTPDADVVKDVDSDLFLTNDNFTITIVDCTLSDGTETTCYQIVTNGVPTDHEMGPWCPDNISDGADKGGIE